MKFQSQSLSMLCIQNQWRSKKHYLLFGWLRNDYDPQRWHNLQQRVGHPHRRSIHHSKMLEVVAVSASRWKKILRSVVNLLEISKDAFDCNLMLIFGVVKREVSNLDAHKSEKTGEKIKTLFFILFYKLHWYSIFLGKLNSLHPSLGKRHSAPKFAK